MTSISNFYSLHEQNMSTNPPETTEPVGTHYQINPAEQGPEFVKALQQANQKIDELSRNTENLNQ